MGKLKYIIIIILTLIVGFILWKFFNYRKFFDEKEIENLSNQLAIPVFNYTSQFENEDLSNIKNLDKMVLWARDTYSLFEDDQKLLNYGYKIKFDSKSGHYVFCLFGEDKKSSSVNFSFDGIKIIPGFSVRKPSFYEYLINGSNYDIVLFSYKI